MTIDVCVSKNIKCENNNSYYWFFSLLFKIIFVAFLIGLSVVGLISYFWQSSAAFKQDDLVVFLSCFIIPQLLWHYFSLYSLQSEGVVRNRRSVWMFICPNHLLISGLTILLAVFVFYWNYLFIPERNLFYLVVFLIILLPQLFVRIWDFFARKDSSVLAGLIALALLMLILAEEIRYGIGFRYLTSKVEKVAQLESQPGHSQVWGIPIPDSPRWKRDGMTYYPQLFSVLKDEGFRVDKKTHLVLSPQAEKLLEMGIVPFNHYQGQAFSGIKILDRHRHSIYEFEHPNQFKNFEHISPFILKALLVWENDKLRHLVLPPNNSNNAQESDIELNYLIEGPRIIKSLGEYLQYKVTGEGAFSGGSTLMTTLEKITNTPGGRTQGVTDKIRQMIGAGLHLYANDSSSGIKKALVDFLNTVPMAGGPRTYEGELYGFGASYYAWFGHSIDELNAQLNSKDRLVRSQAFKNICTLIVSIRRPSQLLNDPQAVEQQANILLKRLNQKSLLNSALYVKAKALHPAWMPQAKDRRQLDYAMHRESFSARNQYTQWVRRAVAKKSGDKEARKINLQTVDLMPVTIEMSTDAQLEQNIRKVLDDMYSDIAQKSPFVQNKQKGLLNNLTKKELQQIEYAVTVLEIDESRRWKILANTDTQANVVYNPAKQGRFQWGSTAKLRVLVNYLMIIHDEARLLQSDLQQLNSQRLQQYKKSSVTIKRLLAAYIDKHPQAEMNEILDWAMSRRISADPGEKFLTGESWHQFHNYKKSDDRKNPNLWQMTTESINLSYVRLMRDVVDYYIEQMGYDKKRILNDKHNLTRKKIIADAIKKEEQFYHQGMNFFIAMIKAQFHETLSITDKEIVNKAREVVKDLDNTNDRQMQEYKRLASMFKRITSYEKSWLLAKVRGHESVNTISVDEEQERIVRQTSNWFRTNKYWLKNTLYTFLEQQAFANGVTPAWKKLGYPFKVSPSYAVVLGSSGDTPMSLLELAGTLLNDGVHEKNITAIERIVLAPGSEFETPFKIAYQQEKIIPETVAAVARKAMEGVLHKGTAIFASRHPLMQYVQSSGAKTGTGDNRHYQTPVNRSAAVLSVLDGGEGQAKYAICITMSVTQGNIERYKFTSKVPVRILARIADHLTPIVAKKSIQELQIDLAKDRIRRSKKHNLALASRAVNKRHLQYKSQQNTRVAKKQIEDPNQLFENLF